MIGCFVTGTDTGVSKTIVSTGLTRLLVERGIKVGVMKPIETGCSPEDDLPHDGALLAKAACIESDKKMGCSMQLL